MGLDVMVYKGPLTKIDVDRDNEVWDLAYENEWLIASDHNGFGRLGSLEAGAVYEATGSRRFRAGPYSMFGRYRGELCQLVLGVEPQVVWAAPEDYEGRPFFEQIQFGDNEDTIGPEACAKLAAAYYAHQWLVAGVGDEWFAEHYAIWREAFSEAAKTEGAINYG